MFVVWVGGGPGLLLAAWCASPKGRKKFSACSPVRVLVGAVRRRNPAPACSAPSRPARALVASTKNSRDCENPVRRLVDLLPAPARRAHLRREKMSKNQRLRGVPRTAALARFAPIRRTCADHARHRRSPPEKSGFRAAPGGLRQSAASGPRIPQSVENRHSAKRCTVPLTSCRPNLMCGSANTTAHRNTHLSMSLKRTGFVGRDAIPWGISGSVAPVP